MQSQKQLKLKESNLSSPRLTSIVKLPGKTLKSIHSIEEKKTFIPFVNERSSTGGILMTKDEKKKLIRHNWYTQTVFDFT